MDAPPKAENPDDMTSEEVLLSDPIEPAESIEPADTSGDPVNGS